MNQRTRTVKVGASVVGAGGFSVFAGPCSIESREQFAETSTFVKKHGAIGLRGGVFKLRTNPASFQGLGEKAYDIAREIKLATGLPFVSEVTDPRQISDLEGVVDMFQVGSRNMHNYALLKELGATQKPVLLKRGFAALMKEWILAADYIVQSGNDRVILCERGIRTFETATRNTFDINAIVYAKQNSSFPVIADPSHATGDAKMVTPVALAAAAAGADGLLVEVHPRPSEALSDGYQSLTFTQFEDLMSGLKKILPAVGKELVHV
jgi:3-deoxy-7-phosphoheptulonate synthase